MSLAVSNAASFPQVDSALVEKLCTQIIKPLRANLVERPWGGTRIRELKGLCPLPDQRLVTGMGIGESFEIAACDDDAESMEHPSLVEMPDGSLITLAALLRQHGRRILGSDFVGRYGAGFPLLPKLLDIEELLSVQGHPPGNTEAYVIIDADPGATIRLGFNRDIDAHDLKRRLGDGRREQQVLLEKLGADVDTARLQQMLKTWFSRRQSSPAGEIVEALSQFCTVASSASSNLAESLDALKRVYWETLDLMNEIPVSAGLVIHNANPLRIVEASGMTASAEVHALGNPQEREIVALEIRKPGPTMRAWDNVRFPLRDVDIDAALQVLNLKATAPSEFIAERMPVPGSEGVSVSIDSEYFRIEHLYPGESRPVRVAESPAHYLYALRGRVTLIGSSDAGIGSLEPGQSALVPAGIGAYRVEARSAEPEVLRVTVPL